MTYSLNTQESLGDGLKRSALAQIDGGRAALSEEGESPARRVHEVRKALKRLRAVLRIAVAADLAGAESLAEKARDLARKLSPWRDRDATLAVLKSLKMKGADKLVLAVQVAATFTAPSADDAFAPLARDVEGDLDFLRRRLAKVEWQATPETVAPILKKVRRRAVKGMRKARQDDHPETWHAWRKRVKHYGYAARLFAAVWAKLALPKRQALEELGEILGDERDLVLLEHALAKLPQDVQDGPAVSAARQCVEAMRLKLRKKALRRGEALLSGKSKGVKKILRRAWPKIQPQKEPPPSPPARAVKALRQAVLPH